MCEINWYTLYSCLLFYFSVSKHPPAFCILVAIKWQLSYSLPLVLNPIAESEVKRKISENQVMGIRDEEEYPKNQKISEIEIIHLDDDDDDMADISKGNDPAKAGDTPGSEKDVWHYIDPSGNEQGPFKLSCLRYWKECGYFDGAFKVWKTGQTEEDAILLTVVLGSAVPDS